MRFTITRAVIGLSFDAIQLASTVRRPDDFAPGLAAGIGGSGRLKTLGKPGCTLSPRTCGLPRLKTNVSGTLAPFSTTQRAMSTFGVGGALRRKFIVLRSLNHSLYFGSPSTRAPSRWICSVRSRPAPSVGADRLRLAKPGPDHATYRP